MVLFLICFYFKSKRKGMSADEKKAKIFSWFYEKVRLDYFKILIVYCKFYNSKNLYITEYVYFYVCLYQNSKIP